VSYPRVVLPATGSGFILVSLLYNRFFLTVAGLLLLILIYSLVRTTLGGAALKKERKG